MLHFHSASARIVNTKRAVMECLEAALGSNYADSSLIIFHASIGHNFQEIVDQAREMAPNAKILASSCCGVVGKEGVSESLKDIALMAIKADEFEVAGCDEIYGYNSYEKSLEIAKKLKSQNKNINMIYFLASGIDIDNDLCIKAFEDTFGPEVTIFGATSSDNMKGFIS